MTKHADGPDGPGSRVEITQLPELSTFFMQQVRGALDAILEATQLDEKKLFAWVETTAKEGARTSARENLYHVQGRLDISCAVYYQPSYHREDDTAEAFRFAVTIHYTVWYDQVLGHQQVRVTDTKYTAKATEALDGLDKLPKRILDDMQAFIARLESIVPTDDNEETS